MTGGYGPPDSPSIEELTVLPERDPADVISQVRHQAGLADARRI